MNVTSVAADATRTLPKRRATTKYRVESPPTGETFELVASSRTASDGKFRFVWTLAPGKRGPGEHFHQHETETFEIVSGVIRIWIANVPKDYHPGDVVAIPPGVPHRFLNAGSEPVVINVDLDGPRMEDLFAPMAVDTHGRKGRFADIRRMIATLGVSPPSTPTSAAERGMLTAISAMFRWLGARPYEPVHGWDAD